MAVFHSSLCLPLVSQANAHKVNSETDKKKAPILCSPPEMHLKSTLYMYIYTVTYIRIYTYIYACVSNIHICMCVMETISPIWMMAMSETVIVIFAFITMDIARFYFLFLPSLPPSAATLQSYILDLLCFSLSSLQVFPLSSAKNKPSLATTFQSSVYKIKLCVESEKCTCGIVYIFTPCFRYFTDIRSYHVHFYICSIPVTGRKFQKTFSCLH